MAGADRPIREQEHVAKESTMLGSASCIGIAKPESGVDVREPWGVRTDVAEGRGSVTRVEYLPGIGWVSRDPWPQREKRSPR